MPEPIVTSRNPAGAGAQHKTACAIDRAWLTGAPSSGYSSRKSRLSRGGECELFADPFPHDPQNCVYRPPGDIHWRR
ncbi:hypothetical protein CF165_27890 [Amycolatopsis vastitatis]|uniref:Uncharacterized protein n=2 Tax=Amycolatopsis vastitatis TaxID=1905142 RepID=A0A229T099_9PSEU|nr:hypothetical protein CF165_27890 [Amycolatopsis vastitatis]